MREGVTPVDVYDAGRGVKIVWCRPCNCRPGTPYCDGSTPEYYQDDASALAAFLRHRYAGDPYWGVHLRGLHVLNVLPWTDPISGKTYA